MSPEQELYDRFFAECLKLRPKSTFDYLPGEKETVDYPIICVGNVSTLSSATKMRIGGTYTIDIDVWGARKQRIDVAELTDKIYSLIKPGIIKTANYQFYAYFGNQSKQLSMDTSVPNVIYHRGALTLELKRF